MARRHARAQRPRDRLHAGPDRGPDDGADDAEDVRPGRHPGRARPDEAAGAQRAGAAGGARAGRRGRVRHHQDPGAGAEPGALREAAGAHTGAGRVYVEGVGAVDGLLCARAGWDGGGDGAVQGPEGGASGG